MEILKNIQIQLKSLFQEWIYQDCQIIKSDWTVENLQSVIVNAFLKCEIDSKTPEGDLIAKVSHSGAAGY